VASEASAQNGGKLKTRRTLLILLIFAALIGLGIYFFKGGPKTRFSFSGPHFDFLSGPTSEEKSEILQTVRDRLKRCENSAGPETVPSRLARLNPYTNPYYVRLWLKGKKLFERRGQGGAFEASFPKTLQHLCAQMKGREFSPEELKEVRVEVSFAYDLKPFDERYFLEKKKRLSSEMGLFGIFLPEEGRWIYPADFSRRNVPFKKLFRALCGKEKGQEECLDSIEGRAFIFRAFNFVDTEDGSPLDLFRLSPFYSLKTLEAEEVDRRLHLLGDWFLSNLSEGGNLPYLFVPSLGRQAKAKNPRHYWVRQWMATWFFQRLANFIDEPDFRQAALKNLTKNLERTLKIEEDREIAYIRYGGEADLGCASGALMSLLESRHPERAKLIRYLANFILGQQEANGKFRTFYLPADRDDNQDFYPGEAMLALMILYEKDPKAHLQIPERMDKAFRYYRDHFRAHPNPAFVPWQTEALYKLFQAQKNREVADFIFEMNDFLVKVKKVPEGVSRFEELESLGRLYDPSEPRPKASIVSGGHTEGMTDALTLAVELQDRERVKAYSQALRLWLSLLFRLQYTSENSFYVPQQKAVLGAFRISETDNNVQVDNNQHGGNALLKVHLLNRKVSSLVFEVPQK